MGKPSDRAAVLRAATHSTHDTLDKSIMAARPFDSVANYSHFLKVQHAFHRDVSPLYDIPALRDFFPDLAHRARLAAVVQDAADLGIALPDYTTAPATTKDTGVPEALGWLYVVEGSNLGAAFLFKAALKLGLSATYGARHLAGAPEGRAAQWRDFRAALDAVRLEKPEEARAIAGANAAFAQVRKLVSLHLG
ncbi:biliverdin-producing heme oxygenase [Xinfangfangia sp. D13-10-4-6]|nr:biliverdin-producing heme oxygenase [Pseudogemmobacter hezensis]